ncbi:MAG: hypothetical protein LUQ04_07895 [Methanoregula sp.]|nr:hypothetical protein [Methanoregula sp.]
MYMRRFTLPHVVFQGQEVRSTGGYQEYRELRIPRCRFHKILLPGLVAKEPLFKRLVFRKPDFPNKKARVIRDCVKRLIYF